MPAKLGIILYMCMLMIVIYNFYDMYYEREP